MRKRVYALIVKGQQSTWSFEFEGDPRHVEEWRADGLHVDEVCNSIPMWLPIWATRLWCTAQDILNWRPWR